jgi:hypothetical protein
MHRYISAGTLWFGSSYKVLEQRKRGEECRIRSLGTNENIVGMLRTSILYADLLETGHQYQEEHDFALILWHGLK